MTNLDKIHESISKSFDEGRAASSGVVRTAGLWAAALAIIWITGLEPTLHVVRQTSQSLIEVNSARQDAALQVSARKREVVNETQKLNKFIEFFGKDTAVLRDSESKRLDTEYKSLIREYKSLDKEYQSLKANYDKLRSQLGSENESVKVAEEKKSQAQTRVRRVAQAITRQVEFNSNRDELKKSSIKKQEALVKEKDESLKNEAKLSGIYLKAKEKAQEQDRNVGFKLFGVEFESPPLLAPLLWCLFCVGLLGYLSNARRKSILFCDQGIRTLATIPGFSGNKLADISGRLPTWTMRSLLTEFAIVEKKGKEYKILVQESWVTRIFGSNIEQNFTDVSLFLIPLILWATLVRVSWIALEFSHHVGQTWAKALLPVALIVILSLMMIVCIWWVVGEKIFTRYNLNNKIILTCLVSGILLISILSFYPSVGIRFGVILQGSLPWIAGIASIFLFFAYFVVEPRIQKSKIRGVQATINILQLPLTRRSLIFAVLSGVGLFFALTHNRYRSSIKSIALKQKALLPSLPPDLSKTFPGFFYRKRQTNTSKESKIDNPMIHQTDTSITEATTIDNPMIGNPMIGNPRPQILHYISKKGIHSKSGKLPKLENLEPYNLLKLPLTDRLSKALYAKKNAEKEKKNLSHETSVNSSDKDKDKDKYEPSPRVNLASASWSFEEAAIDMLQNGIDSHESKEVCQLLLWGIQHDLLYKQRTNNSRKKAQPSFRLYDLLAGIAVRYRQDESFKKLLDIIEDPCYEYKSLLEPRVEKWQDESGEWRQRWRNTQKKVKWKSGLRAVVF